MYHANVNVDLMGKKCNLDQWWNNDKCRYECKKHHAYEKYLASIMDDSAIMCDEVIESCSEEANSYGKKATCKTQNFYILLAFLLITIALLIAVSIYCYLIKYRAKQKHLLPFHNTNNELIKVLY